jgi:hypothetical protein
MPSELSSDSLTRPVSSDRSWLLGAFGVVVILGQLGGVAFIAQDQVDRAGERQARMYSERLAVAQCMASDARASRERCVQQAALADAPSERTAIQSVSDSSDMIGHMPSVPRLQGMLPASFAPR